MPTLGKREKTGEKKDLFKQALPEQIRHLPESATRLLKCAKAPIHASKRRAALERLLGTSHTHQQTLHQTLQNPPQASSKA